ncbi:MAG: glycerate kinase [Pseudonocardia sp.]|nr:glycerate kinase [Pseudonocardia sp.]
MGSPAGAGQPIVRALDEADLALTVDPAVLRPEQEHLAALEKEPTMRILVAPDKFKGSLTAAEVAHHIGRGLRQRGVEYRGLPLADGGDGSVAAAVATGFTSHEIDVVDAIGRPHRATVAVHDNGSAVVEVANTCGLHTLPHGTRAPLTAASTGLGAAIRAVYELGAHRIVVALGGSASTDGGVGMLDALGVRFRDEAGEPVSAGGGRLHEIHAIDTSALLDLSGVEVVVATDVQNPLTGPDGAAAVYGPQKGANPDQIRALDSGLAHLVDRFDAAGHAAAGELATTPGAGAAGGLGFASLLLGGRIVSGADYFLDLLGFDTQLDGCDVVITGEGRMDDQTLQGKLPAAVARRSGHRPVIAVVGRRDVSAHAQRAMGITAIHALSDRTVDDPATDPDLSRRLLEQLGATILLPQTRAT